MLGSNENRHLLYIVSLCFDMCVELLLIFIKYLILIVLTINNLHCGEFDVLSKS